MQNRIVGLAVSVGVVMAWFAYASEAPATRPTTRGWRIVEVTGLVQYRPIETGPWGPALPGTVIAEEGDFRTGLRSKVVLQAGAERKVIDRLGTVGVRDMMTPTTMDIGMKYGRVRYEVDPNDPDYGAFVASGGKVLAVRDGPRPPASRPATLPAAKPSAAVRFVRFWFGTGRE